MNWYKTITSSYNYVGNCIDSFDEYGDSNLSYFEHTSDCAVQNEHSRQIDEEAFFASVTVPPAIIQKVNGHNKEYLLYTNGLLVLYDIDDDIHYFFGK